MKTHHSDRTKSQVQAISRTNSEQKAHPTNPFRKTVCRHYGSFKARIKPFSLTKFDALPKSFKEKGLLGTTRRKFFKCLDYSLIIYSNGSLEVKPCRASTRSVNAGEELSDSFWAIARKAKAFLEAKGLSVKGLKLNRRPKYGVPDAVARIVRQEVNSVFRSMDCSPREGNVENWGKLALNRDNRLSSEQHFALARARLENPEVLESIEAKMGFIIDSNKAFAENLELHLDVLKRLGCAIDRLGRSRRLFRRALRNSATVRGVC